jgi:proteasome accessory factor A
VAERIFGLETEYAFTALGPRSKRIPPEPVLMRFMDLAKELPHLCGKESGGIFLQNGSRFYVDTGHHPELATPEVANPWDACRYVLAGERILASLARQLLTKESRIQQVFITSCNISYAGHPSTWACHESYGHQADLAQMPPQLIPHLVSRIVYTGAGGFNNRSAGLEFMISPRVSHLVTVSSSDSQRHRGIYHDKNESLSCEGFHRLHVLCGESVSSHASTWLKVGATAVIVAMIEAGILRKQTVHLLNPLEAMANFAMDVTCTARARAVDGRQWSAIEIQRRYLEQAEAHADHPMMPPWTPQVCQRWRAMLDRLEHAPGSVAKTLDWAIKLSLYREFAAAQGVNWDSLPKWNEVLLQLSSALRQKLGDETPHPITVELLGQGSLVADEVARLTPWLRNQGLSWDDLPGVLNVRQQLFEIDSRWGQLDDEGIFNSLDQAGVLEHRVPGVDNVEYAMHNPPAVGRAHLRGKYIKRLHQRGTQCRCDWKGVWDFESGRFLDLSDPFTSEEKWYKCTEERPRYDDPFPRALYTMLRQAFQCYDRGRFEEAHRLLERIRPIQDLLDARGRLDLVRLSAWVHARRGFVGGEIMLNSLMRQREESLWGILDYISVFRFQGLTPAPETAHWIQRGSELLARQTNADPEAVAAFCEQHGYLLMTEGRFEESRAVLEEVCRPQYQTPRTMRILCRGAATLGEVHRRMGNREEARRLLEETRIRQSQLHFEGEMADFTLTYLAKLQEDRPTARLILGEVKRIQNDMDNLMGEARTLLLEARLSDGLGHAVDVKHRLLELREQLPALANCRLLDKVLGRWDEWTSGRLVADETGDVFWGV